METATPTITGTTKLVGLLGSPVKHSLSPAMHTASFAHEGVDAVYIAFDVVPDQLETVVRGLADTGAAGYNVTMPCKTKILPYLDELSPAAELMGAVNTVMIQAGRSIGHNTDGEGYTENLRRIGFDPKGKVVTLLGAGGAGSAIFTQLALDGAKEVRVFNIKDDFWGSTQQKVKELSEKTGTQVTLHDLADRDALRESIAESDLLGNATRVGMADMADQCLVDDDMLHDGLVVTDVVYDPRETKLIKMAKARGLKTATGLGMLLQQAALGEKAWFGIDMPVEYIEEKFF